MATSSAITEMRALPRPKAASRLTRHQKQLLTLTLFTAALLPLVPDQLTLATAAFCIAFGALALTAFGRCVSSIFATSSGLFLAGFFALCMFSMVVALSHGLPWLSWFRALSPFIFLVCYFFLAPLNDHDAAFVLNCLHVSAFVWAARILLQAWHEIPLVLQGITPRLTYVTLDTLIPFGFLGVLLSLFNPSPWAKRWRIPSGMLFAFFIVTCAYRSQIVLSAGALIVFVYRSSFRTRVVGLVVGIAVAVVAFNGLGASFQETLISRFVHAFETGLGVARQREMAYAFEKFIESPVWGNGLGYPIPLDVGHALDDYRWSDFDAVSYVHNVWLYLLMDVGALGLLCYAGFFGSVIYSGIHRQRNEGEGDSVRWCAAFTLILLLVYTSCQAAFRNIQFNLMLSLLAATACQPSRPCAKISDGVHRLTSRG